MKATLGLAWIWASGFLSGVFVFMVYDTYDAHARFQERAKQPISLRYSQPQWQTFERPPMREGVWAELVDEFGNPVHIPPTDLPTR